MSSGDIIEAIEGKTTRDMSLAEIDGLLAGQPGSVINVSIVRPRKAQPVKTAITREMVTDPPVSDKMLDAGIGYIKIDDFPKGRSQDVAAKLKQLEKDGAKKIVLDLRNSGDGEEDEGVATANLFLNHGTITYLQGQKYPKQTFNADPQKAVVSNLPLVVLVNRGTAGPAEIVASASHGECARRRCRRQDLRVGRDPEGHRDAGWLGADSFGSEVLLAFRQGAGRYRHHA